MQKENSQYETGGIIIGYYDEECINAIITECTRPPRDSVATTSRFFRGIKGLNKLLEKKWKQKKEYYLGEWHLHPGRLPSPSMIDIAQMKKIENDLQFNCKEPILLILGEEANCPVLKLILFRNNKQYFYNEVKRF